LLAVGAVWIDLLDPSEAELREKAPRELEEPALQLLLRPHVHDDEPRPTMQSHGDYVFGVFLTAVYVESRQEIFYPEVDLVITHETILTVRKTPVEHCPPFDVSGVKGAVKEDDEPGMIAYRIVDEIAEQYLDLIDKLDEKIDDLEDLVDSQSAQETRARISELRHGLLRIRRTLSPMRDAVRRVVDDVVEVSEGEEVFPQPVEIAFNSAYDKFLRATDGLDLARDLLGGVRDYSQAKVANDQNEVMKRLTVVASLLLLPTFIVGLYGQNFVHIPELHWHWGYWFSWGLIVGTTILQLAYFRWKRWI
jgi:magnesium transporter